jgi:peptidoglycan-N-acetylglucosamine deacetylase
MVLFAAPTLKRRTHPITVALTIDAEHPDRPACSPDACERIVDYLAEAHVAASFFLQGRWASAYPDLARRIADDGHLIGNHSHAHVNLSLLTPQGIMADIRSAEESIRQSSLVDPRPWFRCPFGSHSHTTALVPALRTAGYHDAHWNVVPEDWRGEVSERRLAARVVDGVLSRRDGAVVLLHSWPAAVPGALRIIVESLRAVEARFVTVAELPRQPAESASWMWSECPT